MNKKGFSFIEILISISIIAVLAVIATTANNNIKNNSFNAKVISDLNTIESALISFTDEGNSLPMPDWNNNNFKVDWSYSHDYSDSATFGAYWKFTESTLPKKILDSTPLDPKTSQYYSYWISKESNQFEVAWVLYDKETDSNVAKVNWNYTAEEWIYNLIREYNWSNFVTDKGSNLPYNPFEKLLVVSASDWNTYVQWDTIINNSWAEIELFFSDWSVSVIEDWTTIVLTELDFPNENDLVSKVNLFLQAWSIWTKATKLDEDSSFEVFTSDATASVRWTIFAIKKDSSETTITINIWELILTDENKSPLSIPSSLIWYLEYNTDWESSFAKNSLSWDPKTITIRWWIISQSSNKIEINDDIFSLADENHADEVESDEVIANIFLDEVIKEVENKVCYLWWETIKDWDEIEAFKEKYVLFWESCWSPINRKCNDWVLNWNSNYRHLWPCLVKAANQCAPYKKEDFNWTKVVNQWELDYAYKNQIIYISWVEVWSTKYKRKVECNTDWRSYKVIKEEVIELKCNSTLTKDEANNTCKCETWKTLNKTSWKCEAPILYSGSWCWNCPWWYKKSSWFIWIWDRRKCVNIIWEPTCQKKKWWRRKDRSWSWYAK